MYISLLPSFSFHKGMFAITFYPKKVTYGYVVYAYLTLDGVHSTNFSTLLPNITQEQWCPTEKTVKDTPSAVYLQNLRFTAEKVYQTLHATHGNSLTVSLVYATLRKQLNKKTTVQSPLLLQTARQFLDLRATKNLQPHTLQKDYDNFKAFSFFLTDTKQETLTLLEITPSHLAAYAQHLQAKGNSHNTIVMRLLFLKQVFRYAIQENKLTASPFDKFSAWGSMQKPETIEVLTLEEVRTLFALQGLTKKQQTALDLFEFQYETGLAFADTQQFDYQRDVVSRHDGLWLCVQRQKTKRHAALQKNILTAKAVAVLAKYANQLPKFKNGTIYNLLLQKIAQKAGIRQFSSQFARRSCATHLLNEGVPFEAVQAVMGHRNIQTTQDAYARVDFGLLEKVLKRK